MRGQITARDIPDADLEITADAVRLCRAATSGTVAQQILTDLHGMHPEADTGQIVRCAGYAAQLLDPRRN